MTRTPRKTPGRKRADAPGEERTGFVLLHYGRMPADAFVAAARLLPGDAVLDPVAARMTGAHQALGAPELLEALKTQMKARCADDPPTAASTPQSLRSAPDDRSASHRPLPRHAAGNTDAGARTR